MSKPRNPDLAEKIGIALRDLRTESGLTQSQLAIHVDTARTYIGIIERGEKAVTVDLLSRILHPLEITISDFFIRLEQSEQS